MCDEYYFLRKKTSDVANKSKEQVEALLEQITSAAAMRRHQRAPASESKVTIEKETA
ncbi:MAG: hypothetical protein ACT4NU_01030 [Chromatiales bacterium]